MNELQPLPASGLCIRDSQGRGRGVFATRAFRAGELLERAPVLVVPRSQVAPLRGTLLDDYWFAWDAQHIACGLGWAALYNHACPANATFTVETSGRTIAFHAVKDIAVGCEVTINYHGEPDSAEPVWFPTV